MNGFNFCPSQWREGKSSVSSAYSNTFNSESLLQSSWKPTGPVFQPLCRCCLLGATSSLLQLTGVTVNTCRSAETNQRGKVQTWNMGDRFAWNDRFRILWSRMIDSNAFLFVVAPSCIPYPTLAFKKTSGTDGLEEEKKKTSEGEREWVKRQKRELKSCISRQTVEMKRRCLQTEDKPSVTAARGSHLCQCLDDLLQCYNTLENRRTETKFTIQGRGSETFFSF